MEVLNRGLPIRNKHAIIVKGPKSVTQYCCVECPVRCLDIKELEVHLLTHFKEYRYLCSTCGTGLKRKEHLDRHKQEHQEHIRPHVCPECGKGFKRKEHLSIHMTIHTGDKNQTCSLCNKAFYRKDHLQKHQQTHSKLFMEQNMHILGDQEIMDIKQEVDDDDAYAIVIENESMEASSTEPRVPDTKSDRPYACNLCDKTYKRKDHLKLHSQTHLKKEHICSECGKGFTREEQLLMHMNTHLRAFAMAEAEVDDTPQYHYTEMNNDAFDPEGLLVPRMEARGEDSERPHECSVCHRKFKRRQHLKVHSNVHAKQQPNIWCSLCNEGFLSNLEFESHECMYSAEGGDYDEEQPNVPQEAKKENKHPFVEIHEEQGMIQSQLIEPDNVVVLGPRRVFVCKYCDKPFKRKDHYKIHLHVHTGVKSLFCPDCGKGFYRKDHLQKHAQVHAKAKPKPKPKRELPALYPITTVLPKKQVKPEITIHAPSNTKLRVPLQIKVPYQVVMSMDNGEQRAVTFHPQDEAQTYSRGHNASQPIGT